MSSTNRRLVIHTKSEQETTNLGFQLGQKIFSPSVIALIGDLGSGKTVLTRGIARGMGIRTRVKSPSFLIIREYHNSVPLYHFDLYRVGDPEEIEFLGCREYFYTREGVVVIEWADKISEILPSCYLEIKMKIENFSRRRLVFTPRGNGKYQQFIQNVQREFRF